jgi:hypothetical protein
MWPLDIPRTIHIATRNTSSLLEQPARIVQFWRGLNPSFEVVIHNDSTIRQYVRSHYGQQWAALYEGVPAWARRVRACMWRLMWLLEYGGVYVDEDVEPMVPLERFIRADDAFVTSSSRYNGAVNPHFIVARPREPLLADSLKFMRLHMTSTNMSTPDAHPTFAPRLYNLWASTGSMYAALHERFNYTGEAKNFSHVTAHTLPDGRVVRLLKERTNKFRNNLPKPLGKVNVQRKVTSDGQTGEILMFNKYPIGFSFATAGERSSWSDTGQFWPSVYTLGLRRDACPETCFAPGVPRFFNETRCPERITWKPHPLLSGCHRKQGRAVE